MDYPHVPDGVPLNQSEYMPVVRATLLGKNWLNEPGGSLKIVANLLLSLPDSAALNLLSGKRAFIILADGTTNTLADGTGGSHKGAFYCKGKLLFNGTGALRVTGNTNNGIHSADYIAFSKGNVFLVSSNILCVEQGKSSDA